MFYTYMDSPIGRLLLAGDRQSLKILGFSSGKLARGADPGWERYDEPFRRVRKQIEEYFAGDRKKFDVDLDPDATPFQSSVLNALQEIPYGETRSYRDIAEQIGRPKAVRAVGGANGANPIPIIIPCHRVIGANGTLTGFGGGLDSKRFLLDLETRHSGLFSE
jgi:methylated-DNA-[protein]-cysteine S-methyltransferase